MPFRPQQLDFAERAVEYFYVSHSSCEKVLSKLNSTADFDDCIFQTTNLSQNVDLELLGFTLLECMEGAPSKHLRDGEYVRRQRELNKIFGLKNGGRWSGYKLLVDFLDDLFNKDRSAIAKLDRPVSTQTWRPKTEAAC
jgi:hypothetical protein